MAKSALLENLCDAYCKTNTDEAMQQAVKSFCQFAADQLIARSIVGVNYTLGGIALRFADGTDLVIAAVDAAISAGGPSVQVTGGSEKLNARADALVAPSFPITGR